MFVKFDNTDYYNRSISVLCVGLLSKVRGIMELAESAKMVREKTKARFVFAGSFAPASLGQEVKSRYGEFIEILSWVDYVRYLELLQESKIGISIPHPIERYKTNYPTKLFEYMAAGLPVVSSSIGESSAFVNEKNCGLLVDPLNVDEISKAIIWLLDNPEKAKAMGERGRQLVFEKYNWENEVEVLIKAIQHASR
jgi:glycosyltransferase involved in cell wall biosynthesis